MTQENLAEIAGMNSKHLGEIERGKANPTIKVLLNVSSALQVELPSLFFDHPVGLEDTLLYEQTMALVRKLDQPDLQKLHKVLSVVVE